MILKPLLEKIFEGYVQELKFDKIHDIGHKLDDIILSFLEDRCHYHGMSVHESFFVLKKDLTTKWLFSTYHSISQDLANPASFDISGNIIIKIKNSFTIFSKFFYKRIFKIYGNFLLDNKDLQNYPIYKQKSIIHCFKETK